jgi:hypothetical protein
MKTPFGPGAVLAEQSDAQEKSNMRIICSWCLQEGREGFIGEKEPMDDVRETHGICAAHQCSVLAEWELSLPASAGSEHQRLSGANLVPLRPSS